MKQRTSKGLIIFAAAVFALTGFSCSKDNASKKETAKDKPAGHEKMVDDYMKNMEKLKKIVAARVNGADITEYDVVSRANKLIAQRGQPMNPEMKQAIIKDSLDTLIFRELAIQEAIRRKMSVPQQDIDTMLQQYKAKIGTEKDYAEHLKRVNLTEASLIKLILREQLYRMISSEEIFDKIKIDPKKVRETYEKGKKKGQYGQMTFEEARGRIEEELKISLAGKKKQEWEAELKKNAKIEMPGARASR